MSCTLDYSIFRQDSYLFSILQNHQSSLEISETQSISRFITNDLDSIVTDIFHFSNKDSNDLESSVDSNSIFNLALWLRIPKAESSCEVSESAATTKQSHNSSLLNKVLQKSTLYISINSGE